jgi:hypothetical protein
MNEVDNNDPQVVEMSHRAVEYVQADQVHMRQAGATNVAAEQISVRQGGIVRADAKEIQVHSGGVIWAEAEHAELHTSQAYALIAKGNIEMDMSGAGVLVTQGAVQMDQSGAGVVITNQAQVKNSGVVFLLANEVQGDINTHFGPLESVLFGATAGLALGLTMLLSVRRNKSKKSEA